MKDYRAVSLIAFAAIVGTVCSARPNRVTRAIAHDYRRFCHQWELETKGLKNCMRPHGDKLTNSCIAALVRTRSPKPKWIVGERHSVASSALGSLHLEGRSRRLIPLSQRPPARKIGTGSITRREGLFAVAGAAHATSSSHHHKVAGDCNGVKGSLCRPLVHRCVKTV